MQKEDWIWLAIRVFGIYLLVLAVMAVPSVGSSLLAVCWDRGLPSSRLLDSAPREGWGEVSKLLAEAQSEALKKNLSALVSSLLRVVLFGGIGSYLIRNGRLVFRWVFPPQAGERV